MSEGSERITMLHGAGGTAMHDLIKNYVVKHLGGFSSLNVSDVVLEDLDDATAVGNIVLKSDSHTVKHIFFPGGDIGRLAVSGTVDDIAALGAEPFALSCGLILEKVCL